MDNRLKLQEKLESIIGNKNVYFQPPSSFQLSYPCIIYKIGNGKAMYANNMVYNYTHKYDITFISKTPTNSIIDKFLNKFQMCSINTTYISDNLNHYSFTLYF